MVCGSHGHLNTFGGIKWECELFNGRPKALCYPFSIDSLSQQRGPVWVGVGESEAGRSEWANLGWREGVVQVGAGELDTGRRRRPGSGWGQ